MRLRKDRREKRQIETKQRLEEWRNLTPQEQIKSLDLRGQAATKQRRRIYDKMPIEKN